MEENMIRIKDPKTFYFDFDWSKSYDENLKHEIEFIKESNESLAENKRKNKTVKLLLKYRDGNDIHEQGK